MAGTHTVIVGRQLEATSITMAYTFAYGDEWDGTDWDADTAPDLDPFDLVGEWVVTVAGPGTIHGGIYRRQTNNLWREGDFTEAASPVPFPVGGPIRQVEDISATEAWRVT